MKIRFFLAVPLYFLLSLGIVHAQTKTGTTIGQFLMIEPSARTAAMGNAGVTMFEELQSAYYNPGAIGRFSANGVQFTHSPWLADITYDYAAAAVTLGEFGNLFASVTALNSGEIAVTTIVNEHGTGEMYTVADVAFGLGYGRQISERFSVGVQATYLQETIWHSAASAFAISIGTVYQISEHGLRIGASLANFGTRAKFDGRDLRIQYNQDPTIHGANGALPAELFTDDFPLPVLFRVGIGLPLLVGDDHRVYLAADAFHPSDNTESMSVGAEWGFRNTLFLRGGYQSLFQQDSEVGLTLGAGVQYETDAYRVNFDYGWADHGRLEKTHRLTLGVMF